MAPDHAGTPENEIRLMGAVHPRSENNSYAYGLSMESRRFFKRNVLPESSCLHYLLPERLDASVTGRLRRARTFKPLIIRTVKFRNSFIPHCLSNFD